MGFLKRPTSTEKAKGFTSAVILAGGIGSRFGNEDGTKQNVIVGGVPAIVRACLPFDSCGMVDEIVIVARAEEIETVNGYVSEYGLAKVTKVVAGGATRRESSYNGSLAVSDKCKYIAIHDAARCLVTGKVISDTLSAAYRYGAAAAAERVVDTVKIATSNGFIKETADRNFVWLVKTPQVFKFHMYETASEYAKRDGFEATDDCSMAERLGFSVKLVDCGSENIKLTTRDDLALAEYILKKRDERGETE